MLVREWRGVKLVLVREGRERDRDLFHRSVMFFQEMYFLTSSKVCLYLG